tara:strand:+ start:1955 stop:2131 length:177 start_codon:yes stop_codon:yes gene_type:complete
MVKDVKLYRTVEHLVRGQISKSLLKSFNLDYVFTNYSRTLNKRLGLHKLNKKQEYKKQ